MLGALDLLPEVSRIPESILALFADVPAPEPEEAARDSQGWLHDLEAMAADSGDVDRWSAVAVPTLLMQGAESWSPLPETMQQLAEAMPQVERAVWDGQMHFATMTAPDLVAGTLRELLAAPLRKGRMGGRSRTAAAGFCAPQYSPLITKKDPRIVPANFDFCRANLKRDASSSGTSIPSESLNPTARFFPSSRPYMTLIDRPDS